MYLIVGLGNPGKEYAKTRHNVGFLAIDELVKSHHFDTLRENKKFQAELTEGKIGEQDCILAKPLTYMNLSGISVGAICRYYKILPVQVIVIQDDLDLAEGKLRLRKGGKSGGHHGIDSIIEHIGPDFLRIKVGIGKPQTTDGTRDFVLGKMTKEVLDSISRAAEAAECIINKNLEEAQNQFN